jgi:putative ABC transport system permease protein
MRAAHGAPVVRAVRGGLTRRRIQTIVIGLVLLVSTSACVLALGLAVDSNAPFDGAFAAQRGAHAVVTVDAGKATRAELAATGRVSGVTEAAGPFAEATIIPGLPGPPGSTQVTAPPMTLAGRASAGGPLDDLILQQGRWAQRPGELVLSSSYRYGLPLGARLTVTGVPGTPRLTVVGIANSINQSADGWVVPGQIAALRTQGTPPAAQMLYRFASAGTAAAVRADVAAVAAALPPGAVTASQSYLSIRLQESSGIAPIVPFVVAFACLGLVMSVLIVINVISGAVVAGYRRIGILKSIGFTPGQVVAAYTGQVLAPAVAGCLGGVLLGNVLAVPLLGRTAGVYGVGTLRVPGWVDVAVPVAMGCLVGISAVLPAMRAGRLSAVQAIATGRAPRTGRGYAAHRALGKLPLPRPVTIGLAAPFARPARTAVTLTAIVLGATAVTFAVGLSTSLTRVANGLSRAQAEPVQVYLPGGGTITHVGPGKAAKARGQQPGARRWPSAAAQQRAIETALRTQPATLHYTAETTVPVSVAGISQQIPVTAFRGNAAWTGYAMISGHWYRAPGQVDVPTNFLTVTGKAVGDTVTVTADHTEIPVRIVGEVFDTNNRGLEIFTSWQTLARSGLTLTPTTYDAGLRPGTSPVAYARALSTLGPDYSVSINTNDPFFLTLIGLIGTLVLLLAIVAGLGVLNTVVLQTRERVHDLGVFKAIGMTPRQAIAMVMCWVAGTGLLAGAIAVPAGVALHRYVLPVMASAAGTGLPPSYLTVYRPAELVLLALAGIVIAAAGALLPASWAARARAASALRAE